MGDVDETRQTLQKLAPGAKITLTLADGEQVEGTFRGLDGDQVLLDGEETRDVDAVKLVSMELSSAGPVGGPE